MTSDSGKHLLPTGVSEEALAQACRAYAEAAHRNPVEDGIRAVLALSSQHAEAVPVGYTSQGNLDGLRKSPREAWSMWGEQNGLINVPLYASPVPADAGEPGITRDAVMAQLRRMARDGTLVVYSDADDRGLDLDEYADLFLTIRSTLIPTTSPAPQALTSFLEKVDTFRFLFVAGEPPALTTEVDPSDLANAFYDLSRAISVLRTSAPVGQQTKEGEANG